MNNDKSCEGCRYHSPGECANRYVGEDGYMHFPEGECWESKTMFSCMVCWPKLCACADRVTE